MSDLISRDELLRYANDRISKIKEVRDSAKLNGEGDVFAHCNGEITEARRMKQYFNMFAPGVDAVEVVRCRECRLWRRVEKHSGKCPFLIGEHQYTGDDHFCSLAEKREDGEGEMLKDRIKNLLEIMVVYNEKNDNCDECPFYDGWCEGEPGGGCIVEDLTDIVRIAVQKDLLNGGGAEK